MKDVFDSERSVALRQYWGSLGNSDVRTVGVYRRRGVAEVLKRMQSEAGLIVDPLIQSTLEEQGFSFNPETDNKSKYKPEMVYDTLANYKIRPMVGVDRNALRDAIAVTMKIFGKPDFIGKLDVLPLDGHLQYQLKMQKSSGAPHFTSKKDCFHQDLSRAGRIIAGETAPPPCVAFRRVQHGVNGPKGRLVWGYPQSMTIVESRFARPLIEHFLGKRTPMAFGLHKLALAARISEIATGGVVYSIDYSKYDSTLNNELILAAFTVLASYFEFDEEEQKAWDVCVQYFINTVILMPDGRLYRKKNGIPSGSYFTQLVGSICNSIITQYISLRVVGKVLHSRRYAVLGDDGIYSMDDWVELTEIASRAKELGVTVNPVKSERFRAGEVPSFLGFAWCQGLPYRSAEDLAKRMVFPEMPSRTQVGKERSIAAIARMASYLGQGKESWRLFYRASILPKSNNVAASLVYVKTGAQIRATGLNAVREVVFDEPLPSAFKLAYIGSLR